MALPRLPRVRRVHVVLVEMLPGNNPRGEAGLEAIRTYLHSKGFMNGGRGVGTAGWDEVWTNPNYHNQVAPLLAKAAAEKAHKAAAKKEH